MWLFVFLTYLIARVAGAKPNFLFVLTDDQDLLLNGMVPMVESIKLIASEGATFQNAFVNSPICCPSRSTILTGKYAHNTGVRNNSIAGNCSSEAWQRDHEPQTIGNILKTKAGYNTFYAGKYLNQYGSERCGGLRHVPLGYDWWIGLSGNSKYYDYDLSINGTKRHYDKEYLTDVIRNYALDFLNQKFVAEEPFFMMLAPPAAHSPFVAAPRHLNKYPNVKALRTPSFNFSSTDKHWIVNIPPRNLPQNVTILDAIEKHRLQTLLSVDEMIVAVMSKLKTLGVLHETYVIFTSDNGFHIGQFTQPWDKRQPYETDIRVPFLMRGPKINKKTLLLKPVSMVDIAPTIFDLAGVEAPEGLDGRSFKDSIFDIERSNLNLGVNDILIEYYGEGDLVTIDAKCNITSTELSECTTDNWCKCQDSKNNTYACVREISKSKDFKFCQFFDDENFVEAYDLNNDPYELENIYKLLDRDAVSYYKNVLDNLLGVKKV